MDFEIAFHLVLSHAIFNELVTASSNFAHDPFVVTHVLQTMLSFIRPSSEFRRISLCEDVFMHCTNAVSTHHTESRVNLAFAHIVCAYCVDLDARLLVQQQGGVSALFDGLGNAGDPGCCSKLSELCTPCSSFDIPLHEHGYVTKDMGKANGVVHVQKVVGDGQKFGDCDKSQSLSILPAIDGTLASIQALIAVCTDCDEACKEVLSRKNISIIIDAAIAHSNDSNVIEASLALFNLLLKLPSMADLIRCKATPAPITTVLPERSTRTAAIDAIIRLARLALYCPSPCRAAVTLACSLLLFACQNGFRRLVCKRVSRISCALENILQAQDNGNATTSAFALLMLVR